MTTRLFPLFLLLTLALPCLGQDRVLATSQGYQLTQSSLQPALQLLTFLIQGELTPQESQAVIDESVAEFQGGPAELMQSLQDITDAVQLVESKNDPLVLGDFRQKLIAEFYKTSSTTPANEKSAFIKILEARAPIVAYDPKTGVVLTQNDLVACLAYMGKLSMMEGEEVTEQDLVEAAEEVITGFSQIDPETQKLLASGTILVNLYDSNIQQMSPQQKTTLTSHYRQTVGGPPKLTTRGSAEPPKPNALQALSSNGLRNHEAMMKSLDDSGGSSQYWSTVKK
jgi:hypothetical protein